MVTTVYTIVANNSKLSVALVAALSYITEILTTYVTSQLY